MSKNKPNAYFCFMQEWKNKEERKGRIFRNGMRDVQADPKCQEAYKNLTETEKCEYKLKAKNMPQTKNHLKQTGTRELIDEIERNKIKAQEFNDNMEEYFLTLTNTPNSINTIPQLVFYAIHVNFFYSRILDNNEVEYYPAEISIIEFSLEKGIKSVYTQIINEKVRLGYSSAAKDHSMQYHQIPIEAPFGHSDYKVIFKTICKLLEPGKKNGKLPPLYTCFSKEYIYLPVKSALTKIAIANCKEDEFFTLYSIEKLFANIYNTVRTSGIPMDFVAISMQIRKDPFIYTKGIACDFHKELKAGLVYCSESIVKRWIYVLCKLCCVPLKIPMLPGVHRPQYHSIEITDNITSS